MKITFKVLILRIARNFARLTCVQDLKQNKFIIEAEPSETVRKETTLSLCITTI